MQSNTKVDQGREVTRQDVAGALMALSSLPKRQTVDPSTEFDAYCVALDRVRNIDLGEAVRSVLQGGCGHAFFPSPPELRLRCNAVMESRLDVLQRERRAQCEREQRASMPMIIHSAEERRRVADLYRDYLSRVNGAAVGDDPAVIKDKYDAKALAAIPDRVGNSPNPPNP